MRIESPMDVYLQEDLEEIAKLTGEQLPMEQLQGKTILVTGATGLIGSTLVKALACINRVQNRGMQIVALVRNPEKAKEIYGDLLERSDVQLVVADLLDINSLEHAVPQHVDIIFHCAAVATSATMVSHPVNTIMTAVSGTNNVLEIASSRKVERLVYLSSMEVYGTFTDGRLVTEDMMGFVDPLKVRSNYPEGKRMCENLCIAYGAEFGLPVTIARLSQTFGAGVLPGENRVFAQFAKAAMTGTDIVLHTKGKSEGNYCYTADTIRALLTLALLGENNEAYNISNEKSHTSIADMAKFVADKLAGGHIKVAFDIPEGNVFGYAADTKMKLSAAKITALGWQPMHDLEDSYRRMIGTLALQTQR